jgi:autotransporter-associated beta strand protein
MFFANSTAGNASITNNHIVNFSAFSSAGDATITTGGGGTTAFVSNSTAGNGTITTDAGGMTRFSGASSGGNAHFVANAGGTFNTSGLSTSGTTAGSLEGAGSYDLGAKALTVGSNNLSTEVSGVVSGVGGALEKIGTGALTLSGTNTYTGVTSVNGGTLAVNGSIASSSGVTVNSGGTLAGNGTTGAVRIASGGTLGPGASAGLLTVGDLTLDSGAHLSIELGGTTAGANGYDQLRVNGTVALGGATLDAFLVNGFDPEAVGVTPFRIIDNDSGDAVTGTFAGLAEGATFTVSSHRFSISYHGGNGNDVVLTARNDGPVNHMPGAQSVMADNDLAIAGLSVGDIDAGAGAMTVTLSVAHGVLALTSAGGAAVVGSGSSALTLTGTLSQINTTLAAAGNVIYRSASGFSGTDTLTMTSSDNGNSGSGGPSSDTDQADISVAQSHFHGTPGDDTFTALPGRERFDGGIGNDTISFKFKLTDATVTYSGNQVTVDGPSSHTLLTGFETYVFTDGTVSETDGDPLVHDLYYYSHNHDVWSAHVDADARYHQSGWHEGRDPNAFFSTTFYLSLSQDVKAAGVDPLNSDGRRGGSLLRHSTVPHTSRPIRT